MPTSNIFPDTTAPSGFFVPGTCFTPQAPGCTEQDTRGTSRDPSARRRYVETALSYIPRLLGAIDRNPFRPTYGCLDRQFWHYRTAAFPSEMYQEGVLPLALVYATKLPGNRWHHHPRVGELAVAGMRFAARSCRSDGSCDDYYPFEQALGAAVFSLQAAARAYQVLGVEDPELLRWFERRAAWVMQNEESGHLTNHHALAALGLWRVARITGEQRYRRAAEERICRVLDWQDEEGWFEEYGGADPGYQTVTIDCLAKYRKATGDKRLDEPLRRGVRFARDFLHPDGSYGGPCGSRGTYHFYAHGMELLAPDNADAADLADGFLASLSSGTSASFDDDRMFAHRLANLIEAYLDWSPGRGADQAPPCTAMVRYFPHARILVRRSGATHTVVSTARGGVFKHFYSARRCVTDAGLIVETSDGRVATSQWHDLKRHVELPADDDERALTFLSVNGPLHWTRFETSTPVKQSLLHIGMLALGRWARTAVRTALQKRLITGRKECPIRLTRSFEFFHRDSPRRHHALRVTDIIEICSPTVRVRRMAFGSDHESAYVAASGVYQESVLGKWRDLAEHVDRLNSERKVTIVREL